MSDRAERNTRMFVYLTSQFDDSPSTNDLHSKVRYCIAWLQKTVFDWFSKLYFKGLSVKITYFEISLRYQVIVN